MKMIKILNKVNIKKVVFFTLLLVFSVFESFSQEKGRRVVAGDFIKVKMKSGDTHRGKVIENNTKTIVIEANGIESIIKTNYVTSLKILDEHEYERETIQGNPLYSKYYFNESAIGLKKGDGYYQNIMVFGNIFSYGLSNNFSVTGGFETLTLFQGESPTIYLGAKAYTNSKKNVNFALGFWSVIPTFVSPAILGALYGLTTFGNKNDNLSLGIALPFASNSGFGDNLLFQFAGQLRLLPNFAIVADNVRITDNGNISTGSAFSIRWFNKKVAIDLGAATVWSDGFVPVVSAAIKF